MELKYIAKLRVEERIKISKLYLSGIEIYHIIMYFQDDKVSKLYLSGIEIAHIGHDKAAVLAPNCTLVELKCGRLSALT